MARTCSSRRYQFWLARRMCLGSWCSENNQSLMSGYGSDIIPGRTCCISRSCLLMVLLLLKRLVVSSVGCILNPGWIAFTKSKEKNREVLHGVDIVF